MRSRGVGRPRRGAGMLRVIACLLLAACEREVVTVVRGPSVRVAQEAVEIEASSDGGAVTRSLAVENGGNGVLDGLSAVVRFDGDASWLEAELLGTVAPTELRLRADPEGLDGGVHEAVVAVESAASVDGPVDVLVRLYIDEPPPDDADGMPHFVQRGSVTIGEGSPSATIDLTAGGLTPPTVGKSASSVSVRSAVGNNSTLVAVTHELRDEVAGAWTALHIERTNTSGSVIVEWEVIERDDWTVHLLAETLDETASVVATIPPIDQGKAFPFGISFRADHRRPDRTLVRAEITSTTEVTLTRSDEGNTAVVRGYVIEWEGATVAAHILSMVHATDTSDDETITAVDLAKTFLVYSYTISMGTRNRGASFHVEARLTSTTNLRIQRGSDDNTVTAPIYVVSHPDIRVQGGQQTAPGTVASYGNILDPQVALDQAFVAAALFGNGRVTDNNDDTLDDGYHTPVLTATDTLTGTRVGTAGTLTATWFVVEFVDTGTAVWSGAKRLTDVTNRRPRLAGMN